MVANTLLGGCYSQPTNNALEVGVFCVVGKQGFFHIQ